MHGAVTIFHADKKGSHRLSLSDFFLSSRAPLFSTSQFAGVNTPLDEIDPIPCGFLRRGA
jgi:hypothetical protein